MTRALARLPLALLAAASLGLASAPARAQQSWPAADCQILLKAGHPNPVWGTSEKPDQSALLILINYQLAVSLCQQGEILKELREANAQKSKSAAERAKPGPMAKEPMAEALKDALPLPAKPSEAKPSDAPKPKEPAKDGESPKAAASS